MKKKRGRPLEIEWQKSEAELEQRYRQEKNGQRRSRLHALWRLRRGDSMEEVSELLSVSYRSLQRWLAWYRQGGVAEVLLRTPGHGGGLSAQLDEAQLAELRAKVDSGVFHTAQEVADWIQQRRGVDYTVGGIYSLFRRLKITKKVPRRQAEQADPRRQTAWKKGGWLRP
jgi:transposase